MYLDGRLPRGRSVWISHFHFELNFLLSNCSWKGGRMTATFRQSFDLLSRNFHYDFPAVAMVRRWA